MLNPTALLPLVMFVFIVMVAAVAILHFADPHHVKICGWVSCQ